MYVENMVYNTGIKRKERNRSRRSYIDTGGADWTGHYIQVPAYQPGADNLPEDNQRKFRHLVRGEVTAYLSLVFILFITLVGGLMESASIQMAKNYGRADMNRAIECMFAEYQKELLDEYHIFALDGSCETGQYEQSNLMERLEYYGAGNMEQEIKRIQFLTDKGCQSFFDQITAYMEHKYGIDSVKDMLGMTSVWGQQQDRGAEYAKEEAKTQKGLEDLLALNDSELPKEENPIDHVGQLKAQPLLELILPKDRALSEKHTDEKEMLSARARQEGYGDFSDVAEAEGTVSSLLFGEYLLENFSSFTDEGKGGALDYELEYVLAGAGSDKENLEKVARKLMMLRFVPNYAYIQTDGEMKAEAEAAAATLCTLLAVPAITGAAAQAILLAWAYGETVMDLRSMLKGNRVPLVKSRETWQLQLSSLLTLGTQEDTKEGADAPEGLEYKDYLRMLLFLAPKQTSGLRALGIIEQNLRKVYGQAYFRADLCISRVEFRSVCRLRRGIHYEFPTYFGYQ